MIYTFPSGAVLTYESLFAGIFFAALISLLSYKLKMLTLSGSVASLLLGATIFSLGQLKWSIPLLSFFILSSILSKLGKMKKKDFNEIFEKSSRRDAGQVLANGGVAGILAAVNLFIEGDMIYLAFIGSLAVVCADTWATEIGTMKETATYNIKNFTRTRQGISGGISLLGSAGAFGGAFIIAFSAVYWIHLNIIYYVCLIVFVGLFGSFLDSFLGATIQSQNKCDLCGELTEKNVHCGEKANHFRGLKIINNDTVNFIASLSGCILILLLN